MIEWTLVPSHNRGLVGMICEWKYGIISKGIFKVKNIKYRKIYMICYLLCKKEDETKYICICSFVQEKKTIGYVNGTDGIDGGREWGSGDGDCVTPLSVSLCIPDF